MRKESFLIAIAIAVLTVAIWALLNRPEPEPPWPQIIQGFCFAPFQEDQSGITGDYPTVEEIKADLTLLAGRTHAVRTYSVSGTLADIPRLAKEYNINVALGAWIGDDVNRNEQELETLLELTRTNTNIVRLIIGNEVVLRGDIPVSKLIKYLKYIRINTVLRISTAEPWHVWVSHPEIVPHVDYLAVHMLPYWEGIDHELAVNYIVEKVNLLRSLYPDKPIVLAEVGWPSNGRTRHNAVASEASQATFLRRFLHEAQAHRYIYYIMEAFDQPWKRDNEGAVGAYWGVYDVYRQPKFTFTEPIVNIPEWPLLAAISVVIALITFALLLIDSQRLTPRGRSFLAVMAYGAATTAVWVVYDYAHQYLTLTSIIVGLLLLLGMVGVIVVLLAEAHEWAEALWVREHRRLFCLESAANQVWPLVSIHVPTYNEPPEMLIATLNSLAALDYPDYEVLVIDNNTRDPAVWEPVEAHCRRLGPRFRFFHVEALTGFKAGALNYALARTASAAEVIAVIDSDYQVHSTWLRDLVPVFASSRIAIVQAPQDYRDAHVSAFKTMMYSEYRGFFYIGMITRNERNAIIQHGTMTMVRRPVLADVGGWAEWCITEDAELGLRIFDQGKEALYIPRSYGRGLMPDTFIDYKQQRFRWAYGAVQIMRRHASSLLRGGRKGHLTYGQRYHFLAGWLPWLADGVNLLFNLAAVSWTLAMVLAPHKIDPPLLVFSLLPLALFVFKIGKLFYLYRTRVGATTRQTIAAALAGLALTHTIGLAVLRGFISRSLPFVRTPKHARTQSLRGAFQAAREEFLLMLALYLAAYSVVTHLDTETLDLAVWVVVLLLQAIPYMASLLTAVISAFPRLPASLIGTAKTMPNTSYITGNPGLNLPKMSNEEVMDNPS